MPGKTSLVIEYRLRRNIARAMLLKKRHALEDWLDALLRRHKLGDCDGGSIGSGTMEVFCEVKDYVKARARVARDIRTTPFADYDRIYRMAPEESAPPSRTAAFRSGDCLALREGRRWGAAYVAALDPSGAHIVVTLDYLEVNKPDLEVFKRLKPLVLRHHEGDHRIQVTVESRPSKAVRARIELVGNAPRSFVNIDIEKYKGSWVNWKQKPDRISRALGSSSRDKAAGKYLSSSAGEWLLLDDVKRQRARDVRRRK